MHWTCQRENTSRGALENQIDLGSAGCASTQTGSDIDQVDEAHELEGQGFEREAPDVMISGLYVPANVLQRFAQQRSQFDTGLLFKLLHQWRDERVRQFAGRGDQERLRATPAVSGPTFEVDVSGVPEWIENLLGQTLFVEGDAVGGGREPFDVVRQMRAGLSRLAMVFR